MLDPSALKTFGPLFVTPCFGEKLCMNSVLGIIPLPRDLLLPARRPLPQDRRIRRVQNSACSPT